MFNPDRKQEFIDSYTGTTSFNYIQNLFNKCEPIEVQLDKDVCDFIKSEILELLASFSSFSEGTLNVYKSILKQYTDFCCERNLSKDNINHFEEVDRSELRKYTNQFFKQKIYITKEKLEEWCNALMNPVDAYLIYCLFEGIKGAFCEEITDLKVTDLNESKQKVTLCTGRTIYVSQGFIKYALKSEKSTAYKSPVRPYEFSETSEGYFFKQKYDRRADTNQQKRSKVFKKITVIKEMLGAPELSIPNLQNSGMVYYLTQLLEQKGMDVSELMRTKDKDFLKLVEKYNMQQMDSYAVNATLSKYLGVE